MATVKGTWVFNDHITAVSKTYVSFTSNGENYVALENIDDMDTYYHKVDGSFANCMEYMEWIDTSYKTIDFGTTEQTVSDDFYTWLTANATQQVEEDSDENSTITDLTNTTWCIPAGWAATAGYGQFSIDCYDPEYPTDVCNTFVIGYRVMSGEYASYADKAGACNISNGYWNIYGSDSEFTVTITGGEDVTHTALISWLETYGELQVEEETIATATIVYNDNVIATISDGQTATLECAGKIMVGDIVIAYAVEAVNLISFTIDGTTYQAEEGMTWEQWVDSEYNTASYKANSNRVYDAAPEAPVGLNSTAVRPSDDIISSAVYDHIIVGGGSN